MARADTIDTLPDGIPKARSQLAGMTDDNGVRWAARKGGGFLRGVDISHHQPAGTVPLDDVDVLCVRAAYGDRPDALFPAHLNEAVQADVPLIHAYTFYRQTKPKEEQLQVFLRTVEGSACNACPVVDLEWNKSFDGPVNPDKHNNDARWIVERLVEVFGECIVYTAPFFWSDVLGRPDWVLQRPLWLAHYTTPGAPRLPDNPGAMEHWIAHQYQGEPLDRSVVRSVPMTRGDTERAPPPEDHG